MTEIYVTIEDGADAQLISRIFENVKGVVKTVINNNYKKSETLESDKWLETLHNIKKSVDPSVIDWNDERTKYIMSK